MTKKQITDIYLAIRRGAMDNGYKVGELYKLFGISKPTYYSKLKTGGFTAPELNRMSQVLGINLFEVIANAR